MYNFTSIETEINQIRNLLSDNLVYEIEKSKIEIECPFLSLFSYFIASTTGLLFYITQSVKTSKKLIFTVKYFYFPKKNSKNWCYNSG